MSDCIFCKIIAGKIPANVVYQDEKVFAFRDINPVASTHILVIPKEHMASINEADPDKAELMGHLMVKAREIAAQEGLAEKGYRLVINCGENGGQTVYHLHLHILGGRAFQWPPG